MTPPPPERRAPDHLYDLVYITWRLLRSLTAEMDRWAMRHYGRGLRQTEVQDKENG